MAKETYQHDIFLSYASEDRERITTLVQALEALWWSVWWDQHIPPGREFDEFIDEQLEGSKSVVVVWSKMSVKKRWVKTEAEEGLHRGVLFPVQVDEVKIPLAFRRLQAANLVDWTADVQNRQWRSLVTSLTGTLGIPPYPIKADSPEENEEEPSRKPQASWTKPKKTPNQTPDGMVLIPQGPFLYGDEKEEISIDHDYYMDIHPVTNASYHKFIEAGGYEENSHWSEGGWQWRNKRAHTEPTYWNDDRFNQPDQPVVGVSYFEAEAYAKWAGKRLPTEQEWEKAARGTDGWDYPWGEEFDADRCANSVKGKRKRTVSIGTFPESASPYGCQDMAGNVWEWCVSWYDEDEDTQVLRGGSLYNNGPGYFRCANRFNYDSRSCNSNSGFRCAQDAP